MESNTAEPAGESSQLPPDTANGATDSKNMPDYDAAEEAFVDALSTAVNGCMKEMGYFPGMLQLLQDTRHENAVLREQNIKLHSDNVSLSRIINAQKEHIGSLSVRTPIERDMELESLRRQMRHTITERDEIARTYQHLRMTYDQCRRDLAQLTAFTQSKLPGRIEIVRQGPPAPRMPPPPQPYEGMPVMPPFAVPSHRPPHTGAPPIPFNPALGNPGPPGYIGPFATQPTHPSHIRYVSSSATDSSVSRMSMSGAAISPVSPYQPSPPGHSPLVEPSAFASAGPSPRTSVSDPAADVIDLTMDQDAANGGPRKKRRVEGGDIVMSGTRAYDSRPSPAPNEQTFTSNNGNEELVGESMDTDDADDTDAGEGLDSDGRRSEEACLAVAFEQDADGRMWCTMCKLRYNRNLTESAPHAFTSDDTRELVQHCEENHPAGWRTLRGLPPS